MCMVAAVVRSSVTSVQISTSASYAVLLPNNLVQSRVFGLNFWGAARRSDFNEMCNVRCEL